MNASEVTNVGSTSSHRRLADVLTHHRLLSKLPQTRLIGGGQKLVTGMPAMVLRLYGAGNWQCSSARAFALVSADRCVREEAAFCFWHRGQEIGHRGK